MQRILLKFKSIEAKPDLPRNKINMKIIYDENSMPKMIEKVISYDDNIESFVNNLVKDVRSAAKMNCKTDLKDPFGGFVTVVFDESDIGETEEKLIAGIRKLKNNIKNFKNIRSVDNYIDKFHEVSRLEVKL